MANKPTIINTRPIEQQEETTNAFVSEGFNVIEFPCIEITAIDDILKISQQLQEASLSNIVIFTSQHSVKFAYKILPNWDIPISSTVICVGKKTASILEQYYSGHIWIPTEQNSNGVIEILLGLKHVGSLSLITAAGGRKKIQNFASSNNYELNQINVYQRQAPINNNPPDELKLNNLYLLATSKTTLINLKKLISETMWVHLQECNLVCSSARILSFAHILGFKQAINLDTSNPALMSKKLTLSLR